MFKNFFEGNPELKDYPSLGIIGDRVTIDLVSNNNNRLYSGVGTIADKLAIEYCLKNGITPNETGIAAFNSHAAHYLRGRRFFPLSGNDKTGREFFEKYKTYDPNRIVEERILISPRGKKVYTGDLGNLPMYMPREVVDKTLASILRNPIIYGK